MLAKTHNRPITQMRPGNDPTARAYAPQRDLAYIFPQVAREAFETLDQSNWQGPYGDLLVEKGITEKQLGEGVKAFVGAFHFYVGDPTIKNLHNALERAGFFDCPPIVQLLVFERIGEAMAVGFFMAVRDVTRLGEEPPQVREMAELAAAARDFVRQLNGTPRYLQHRGGLQKEIEEARYEIKTSRKAVERLKELLQEAERKMRAAEAKARELTTQLAIKDGDIKNLERRRMPEWVYWIVSRVFRCRL
jgi:hypothetical protein